MSEGTKYGGLTNARRLSELTTSTAGGSVYGGMTNARRISSVDSGGANQNGSVYGGLINAKRLGAVNTSAFVSNGSLYSRLGGDDAISALVRNFYGKALQDQSIKRFFDFENYLDMEAQIRSQIAFVSVFFGGPNPGGVVNKPEGLAYLASLGLTKEQFDSVATGVTAVMRALNAPQPMIEEVLTALDSAKSNVLG